MIHYVTGDATRPIGTGPKLLCHICNDLGGWGKGFVLSVSKRWPGDKRWIATERAQGHWLLGQVQFVTADESIVVANMIAQHGYRD